MSKPRVIAFYLPQFHPIPENDEWWGKGFTEWINVGRAKPLFPGHNQPKIPTDLGYYDLRLPEVREAQAKLAKEAGIEGFCYWHYWFGDRKQLLEKPLKDVVNTGRPNFPFCLGWANESWYAKLWNKNAKGDKLLIEQKYGGEKDYKEHFYTMLPMFKDNRYMTVNGKCIFLIYRPDEFFDVKGFINCWRKLAQKEGLLGFHFIAHNRPGNENLTKYFAEGFDAVYSARVSNGSVLFSKNKFLLIRNLFLKVFHFPRPVNFKNIIDSAISKSDMANNIYPGIISNWDHTPRSGKNGKYFYNFTMPLFKKHIESIFKEVKDKNSECSIVFLKSWNEWGEGNYMEPDIEFGKKKLEILKECIDIYN